MKLRNKKTGEIGYPYFQNWKKITCVIVDENAIQIAEYTSLAELNEEWEDYEEPKEHYFITEYGGVFSLNEYEGLNNVTNVEDYKQLGNYFETEEEAEKAVEKLKAWKRLKDKGFRFEGWDNTDRSTIHNFSLFVAIEDLESINKDLNLLFGGEE